MYTFNDCLQLINNSIENINLKQKPSNLYLPIKYILSIGGKRIRPALVLMSCNIFSDTVEEAINPALAIEIFHNFTLLHDDIMDNSVMRRNQPTVHVKWDNNTAILSGDAMCILAYDYLLKTQPQIREKILPVFTQTALEVCNGQQYDMDFENTYQVTVDEYIKMISLKTAVLIAASMKMGALAGGASEQEADHLYEFGKNIGIAFQLQDDLLDVYGEESTFGKKNGGDIVANKKTFLLIKALEIAKNEDRQILMNLLTSKGLEPDEKISLVIDVFNKLSIKEKTQAQIDFFFNKALQHIKTTAINTKRINEIILLSEKLMKREL